MTPAPQDWSERSRDLARLLALAGLGDRAAFAKLYDRTSAHLFAVVLRINRDRSQAEDILQDVYVKVWRSAKSFDAAQSQPLTWLTSIARNGAIDSLRRKQTQPQIQSFAANTGPGDDPGDDKDFYDTVVDDAAGPLELLSQMTEARALSLCMKGLNPQQRQCVALAFYDGLSHAEVAEQLRQPLGSVKSWVRRGLLALKSCLESAVRRDVHAGST
jgi:RNA polymerase sigma factor (sigma-70 family)